MSQVSTRYAIDMSLRLLRSGVIVHVPLVRFRLVGRQREENGRASYTTGSQQPLQEGAPPTFSPGALRRPDRSWCECRTLLVGLRQASTISIRQKDRLFLYRSGHMGDEASLYSGRRRSTSTGQARRYGSDLSN